VYGIGHSFHDEDPDNIVIGDINMAIDNEGNLYINRGHLCEGIAFWSTSSEGLSSMDEFFAPSSVDDNDKWERYVPSSRTASEKPTE